MARIFLSHAGPDRVQVRRMAEALRRAGHQPWIDEDEILAGESIPDAVARELSTTDYVVLCLSNDALRSGWVQAELSMAAMRQFAGRQERILPVRLEKVELPPIIEHLSHIDLFPGETAWERGIKRLLRSVDEREQRRALPSSEPIPPNNLPPKHHFVGRQAELQWLHGALSTGGKASITQAASVYGLGGVGKTALALAYAYRYAQDYPGGLWWVVAEGEPRETLLRLSADLRLVAPPEVRRVVRAHPIDAPADTLARAAQLGLQQCAKPSLLVLDNVDPQDWSSWIPAGRVRVLATTLDRAFALGEAKPLDVLSAEDATALAEQLAGAPPAGEQEAARDRVIGVELGFLALAVELAARVVKDWAISWVEYERALKQGPAELLANPEPLRDYPRGVLAAIDRSLERCPAGEVPRRLLEGASLFAPDDVPISWALAAAAAVPDKIHLNQALGKLEGLGLATVNRSAETISLHRLVRLRVQNWAAPPLWNEMVRRGADTVVEWLRAAVDPARLVEVDASREHVQELAQAVKHEPERWIKITNWIARYRHLRGELSEAKQLYEDARAASEGLNPENPDLAFQTLNNLGVLLSDIGEYDKAKRSFEQAVEVIRRAFGHDDPRVAAVFSNLARILIEDRSFDKAKDLLQEAIGIDEKAWGPENPFLATRFTLLANVYRAQKDTAKALDLLERARTIEEKAKGPDHPDVALRLTNLAIVLRELGRAKEAVQLLERALDICERFFPPDHPSTANVLSALGALRRDLGDLTGAKSALDRSIRIIENIFGSSHRDLILALMNLADVHYGLGDEEEAGRLLERARTIASKTLPKDHPSRQHADQFVAQHRTMQGFPADFPFAPVHGPARSALAFALGFIRKRDTDPDRFIDALRTALDVAEQKGDIPNATRAALLLGSELTRTGGWVNGQTALRRGLDLAKKTQEPLLVAEAYRLLGTALKEGFNHEQARAAYEDAIRIFETLGDREKAIRTRVPLVRNLLEFHHLKAAELHLAVMRRAAEEGIPEPLRREVDALLELGDRMLRSHADRGSSGEAP